MDTITYTTEQQEHALKSVIDTDDVIASLEKEISQKQHELLILTAKVEVFRDLKTNNIVLVNTNLAPSPMVNEPLKTDDSLNNEVIDGTIN